MSVRHVFAQAHIAHDDELGDFALDGPGGLLHDSVFRPGSGGDLVFALGQTEEYDGGNAECGGLACRFHRFIYREIEDARHGRHFLTHALARTDEQRVDKCLGRKPGLANQRPQLVILAEAAEACDREGHGLILAEPAAAKTWEGFVGRAILGSCIFTSSLWGYFRNALSIPGTRRAQA